MSLEIHAQDGQIPVNNRKAILDSLLQNLRQTLNQQDHSRQIPIAASAVESASESLDSGSCANRNPAILRCILAHNKAMEAIAETKASSYEIRTKAKLAFREAIPPLIGRKNIRDFIACVTYGMAIEVISSGDAIRLLTAARAAASVQDQRSHHKARQKAPQCAPKPRKSAPFRPENEPETIENKQDISEM